MSGQKGRFDVLMDSEGHKGSALESACRYLITMQGTLPVLHAPRSTLRMHLSSLETRPLQQPHRSSLALQLRLAVAKWQSFGR